MAANSRPPGAQTDPPRPCQAGADLRTRPSPVVLVHGTGANAYDSWNAMAPRSRRRGTACTPSTTVPTAVP